MTSAGIQVEGATKGYAGRPESRGLSMPAVSRHPDGGRIRVRGFDPAERRTPVRHMVIFPAPVL
jgi:hypothetical protein